VAAKGGARPPQCGLGVAFGPPLDLLGVAGSGERPPQWPGVVRGHPHWLGVAWPSPCPLFSFLFFVFVFVFVFLKNKFIYLFFNKFIFFY
jgi:hypothetical protein